ncbi:MAG: glycosyltransferase family 4 protein [Syntrophobacterales bacterium]|jgi:glycosyltransferase involved in cell wall biosynthesis
MESKHKGTIAFGPALGGGTATFYRVLSSALRDSGWRVYHIAMGLDPDTIYCDDHTVMLAGDEPELKKQVKELIQWVEQQQIDIIINSTPNLLPAIPHLPNRVRYISIPHNINRIHYIWCTLFPERLSAVVCINKRQIEDLRRDFGMEPDKLFFIPHGIDGRNSPGKPLKNSNQALHITFVGRLDDMHKGVMWLPHIFQKIDQSAVPFQGHIVGDGRDGSRLQQAMRRRGLLEKVTFHGFVSPENIPPLLEQMDIILVPSRYEGFGLSLLEGMASGCVPVATHIRGVTDMIIEQGVQGFLCPMGATREFARATVILANDRDKLWAMSKAAQATVTEKFNVARMHRAYDELFSRILTEPPIPYRPRPLEEVKYPPELQPSLSHAWKKFLPGFLKKFGRKWYCRLFDRIP